MKHSIMKQIRWSMGHRLSKEYKGKCKNVHGHEYLCEIEICSLDLDKYDFVVDFGVVKKVVKKWIDDNLDHGFMVWKSDIEMLNFLIRNKQKHFVVDENPTAEVIAKLIYEVGEKSFSKRLKIKKVTVWETPSSWASYE